MIGDKIQLQIGNRVAQEVDITYTMNSKEDSALSKKWMPVEMKRAQTQKINHPWWQFWKR